MLSNPSLILTLSYMPSNLSLILTPSYMLSNPLPNPMLLDVLLNPMFCTVSDSWQAFNYVLQVLEAMLPWSSTPLTLQAPETKGAHMA
jgi:hypothetical protein